MSETIIPPWKQELLKRRERNAKLSNQENSTSGSVSTILSQCTNVESEGKDVTFGRQRILDQNVSGIFNKVKPNSHGFILEDGVDGFGDDTRRQNECKSTHSQLTSNNGIASRLNRPNDSSMQARGRPEKEDRNLPKFSSANTSNQEDSSGISRLDKKYCGDDFSGLSPITLDNGEREQLKSFLGSDRGVDNEHIRPKDVKKMWKKQESKEELYTDRQNVKGKFPNKPSSVNHVEKDGFTEVNERQATPRGGTSIKNHPQGDPSVVRSSVPKAYKSPFAKQGWSRQSGITNKKSYDKNSMVHIPQSNGLDGTERKPSLDEKKSSSTVIDQPHEMVNDDHIPSVKSLLGLFGGRQASNVSQKPQDDLPVSHGQKTWKQVGHSHPDGARPKASDHSLFNLSRHHPEPNLYSVSNSPQLSGSQNADHLQTDINKVTLANKAVALPSHHVSRGIEERMSRLRRASQSSVEEMENSFVVDESVSSVSQAEKSRVIKDHPSILGENTFEPKEEVAEKNLLNKIMRENPLIGKNSFDNHSKQSSYVKKSSVEKLDKEEKSALATNVNDEKVINKVVDGVNTSSGSVRENHHREPIKSQENEVKTLKQPFDKILSVFGPRAGKKSTLDVNDMKEPKSNDKYLSKQSNHGVEGIQSDTGLGDQVLSTENSKGIMKNQQENKIVIKNEESSKELHSKAVKKPRRSLLNVVDPLDVLQLTKDPILLKEKPASSDLGLMKEPLTGRAPTVEIIKSQPDNKAKIAKINRAWDLNKVEPSAPSSQPSQQSMPTNGSTQAAPEVKPQSTNIPVTPIDLIPVSSIDEVAESDTNSDKNIGADSASVKLGNTTFYAGTLTSASVNHEDVPITSKPIGEFIPVSSIDGDGEDNDDSSLLPPPEIVFEKKPEKIKSSFQSNRRQVGKCYFT